MKRSVGWCLALSLSFCIVHGPRGYAAGGADPAFSACMQRLWQDYVALVRSYTTAAAGKNGKTYDLAGRLQDNEEQIAGIARPYCGERAARKLGALLKDHVALAAEYADAVAAGGPTIDIEKRWCANTGALADFIFYRSSGANREALDHMFREHVRLLKTDIGNIRAGAGAGQEDLLSLQTLSLARTLADGIACSSTRQTEK